MYPNVHTLAVWGGLLGIQCLSCRHRAVLDDEKLNISRGSMTPLERALELYLEFSKATRRTRVASERERILTKYFLPVLKGRNIDTIDDRDIGKSSTS